MLLLSIQASLVLVSTAHLSKFGPDTVAKFVSLSCLVKPDAFHRALYK